MTRIVTFGEMLLRLSPPGHERLLQSPALSAHFGGAEANVAIMLAQFGLDSTYVTRLPANPLGDAALRALRAEGVRTEHVQRGGDRLGLYFVETGVGHRPSTVVYDRRGSSMSTIDRGTFDWRRVLDGATWLHVTGITPALGPGPSASMVDAISGAKEAGATISLDLNYRRLLWAEADAAAVLKPIAASVDVLIANEEHLRSICGVDVPAARNFANRVDACADCARAAAQAFDVTHVAITSREGQSASDTGWGAVLWDRRQSRLASSSYRDVRIVDRIGSGDAFTAGLIYGLVTGRESSDALAFAVAAGVLKHTVPGDFGRARVDEIDRLVADGATGRMVR